MNKRRKPTEPELMNTEHAVLAHAMKALYEATGIKARVIHQEPGTREYGRPDATLAIDANGQNLRYAVEIKKVDRRATLAMIKARFEHYPKPALLVAPRITQQMAQACREADIQFLDAAGNVYLKAEGLLVFVTGLHPKADERGFFGRRGQGGNPTAARMIFALLCRPALFNEPYRAIAGAAVIALGAVGLVFEDINKRGLIMDGKHKGTRRLLEPRRLMEEWVTNYALTLRPKLNPRRFTATDPHWWKEVKIEKYVARWGGEIAAEKLTGYLKPTTVTIYMWPGNANITRLATDYRLRPDPRGEIEILDAFWNFPDDETRPDIVPPLLVYADLMATLDPRNLETAKMIYDQYLAHVNR